MSGRGSSLSGLLLFVGAAAVMSAMLRTIVTGFKIPPPPPMYFFGGRPFIDDRFYFFCTLGACTIIGTVCGIVVSLWRKPGIRRLIFGICGGCGLGAPCGAFLVSKGDVGMMLLGSLALIGFGLAIRGNSKPVERPDREIDWFMRDDDLTRVPPKAQEPPDEA